VPKPRSGGACFQSSKKLEAVDLSSGKYPFCAIRFFTMMRIELGETIGSFRPMADKSPSHLFRTTLIFQRRLVAQLSLDG
jgi:hypothetical protein